MTNARPFHSISFFEREVAESLVKRYGDPILATPGDEMLRSWTFRGDGQTVEFTSIGPEYSHDRDGAFSVISYEPLGADGL